MEEEAIAAGRWRWTGCFVKEAGRLEVGEGGGAEGSTRVALQATVGHHSAKAEFVSKCSSEQVAGQNPRAVSALPRRRGFLLKKAQASWASTGVSITWADEVLDSIPQFLQFHRLELRQVDLHFSRVLGDALCAPEFIH